MRTELDALVERANATLREELETAWLRGFGSGMRASERVVDIEEAQREAADYAERVVGGSTRPSVPSPQGDQGQAPPPEAEKTGG